MLDPHANGCEDDVGSCPTSTRVVVVSGSADHPPPVPAVSASKAAIPTWEPSVYLGAVPAVKLVAKPGGNEILYVPLPADDPDDDS